MKEHTIYDRDNNFLFYYALWDAEEVEKPLQKKPPPKSAIPPTKLALVEDVQHKTRGCTEGWHSGWPAQLCTGGMHDCTAITPSQRVAQTYGKACKWGTNFTDASLALSRLTGSPFGFQTSACASITPTFHPRGGGDYLHLWPHSTNTASLI